MARRINFTGRRKIAQSDVRIRIEQHQEKLTFQAEIDLKDYDFPSDARVFVEAYRGLSATWKRFDFGRKGLQQPPSDLSLNEFGRAEGILFRVKVTAATENRGRLLGEADGVRPQLPGEDPRPVGPLIEVDRAPLAGEVWKLEFPDSSSGMPKLVMNEQIDDWHEKARALSFRALVMPTVMRQILTQILLIDRDVGDEDDKNCWQQRWLRFAESLPGVLEQPGPMDEDNELDSATVVTEWIDDAVAAFGLRSGITGQLLSTWSQEGLR